MTERNVEEIRRKNLEDNQLFLEQLLMTNIRNDFLHSARSILRRKENTKTPITLEKTKYSTRYNVKVKSGEIPPHVPEWQRKIQRKLLEKESKIEKKKIRLANRRPREPPRWVSFYKNSVNGNPYERVFKPRNRN